MATQAPKTPKPATRPATPATKEPFFPKKSSDNVFVKPSSPAPQHKNLSSGVVDLSSDSFSPNQSIKDEIEANGNEGLDVLVQIKGVTSEGKIRVRADRDKNYDSIGQGSMPWLNPWSQQLGGLYINFSIKNNEIQKGFAALKPRDGDKNDWLTALKKQSNLLGGLGLKIETLPTPINKLENGKLILGVENMKVEIAGYLDTQFSFSLENNENPKIEANAELAIAGLVKGKLQLDNTQESLTGEASLDIDYKSFSGSARVVYKPDGTIEIGGKAAYSSDKLSGEIEFIATDLESANRFAKDAISAAGGLANVQNIKAPPPVPAPKTNSKKRALAATGLLSFNLTDWFASSVNVIVDGKGNLTVVGKITPPAEIELFKQRDWEKELISFEAKAYYGIPIVGNLNLFANISLAAIAKLGPAKIYQIEILGTYSTDPEVQKNIQISGSINISAYAGLRLRAEGGAGIEIADHDLKFGIGVNADIGVKAYADARPTIGYREPGVFYISGTLEMVAQPMLGLGGDFFIKLDSPWWSPAPDKTWKWPLFSKEWPLTDPIGLSATVKDYVLGSGKMPEIELKKPEFDPSKFMTNMVDDNLPTKSGKSANAQGSFKEDGSIAKSDISSKKNSGEKQAMDKNKKDSKKLNRGQSAASSATGNKNQSELLAIKTALDNLKSKEPYSKAEIDKSLKDLKNKFTKSTFTLQAQGDKWLIKSNPIDKKSKPGDITLKMKDKTEKNSVTNENRIDKRSENQRNSDLNSALNEADSLLNDSDIEIDLKLINEKITAIKKRHNIAKLQLILDMDSIESIIVHIHGENSPASDKPKHTLRKGKKISEKDLAMDRPKFRSETKKELRTIHIDQGGSSSIFQNKTGKFKSSKKWHRRHVVSWGDIYRHYIEVFQGKEIAEAIKIFKSENIDVGSKREPVIKAIKKLARDAFNDVDSLFIGIGTENSSLQDALDDAHPDFLDKKGKISEEKINEKVKKFIEAHAIGGYSFKLTTKLGVIDWEVTYIKESEEK